MVTSIFAAEGGTKLKLPPRNEERLFFARNPSIIDDIKIASPSSLRRVVSDLKAAGVNDKFPDERVLLYIGETVLRIAYSEKFGQKFPDAPENATIYKQIFDNVRLGLYVHDNNHDDFFMQVLPCLAVFFSDDTESFFSSMKANLLAAQKNFPQSVLIQYLLGILLDKSGFHHDASSYLEAVHRTDIYCSRVAKAYSDNLLKTNPRFAMEFCSRYFSTSISDYMRIKYVEAAITRRDFDAARREIQVGLANPAMKTDFLLLRGAMQLAQGDLRGAAISVNEYERNGIRSPNFFVIKIQVARGNGNNIQAIQVSNEAIRKFPHNLDIKLAAAKVCLETDANTLSEIKDGGKSPQEKAKALATMALSKNPDNPQATEVLIIYYQKRGEWKTAFDLAEKYLAHSESSEIRITQIRAAFALRRNATAIRLAEELYRIKGDDEVVQEIFVESLINAGRNRDAAELIEELLPSISAGGRSGLLYQRSRIATTENARLADLRSGLVANPRNADCLFAFYEYYYMENDFFNARHYLRQLVALNPNDKKILNLNLELNEKIEKNK
ncbi:MAG: tetratricopeptide repeat protein [Spirochaetaceae bacterium]|nr:tetratricopeptide repeat protein [Spirochaetaceae bacterium]